MGTSRDRRQPYSVQVWLAAAERRKLEARARADKRLLSSYVTKLVVEELPARERARGDASHLNPPPRVEALGGSGPRISDQLLLGLASM